MKKKHVALLMACMMLLGVAIGGSLAWLTDDTEPVTNTFTVSDINIGLAETTGENYKMIPGWYIGKDPKVTVYGGSEDCYVFVKIDKSDNYDDYLAQYSVDTTLWTQLVNDNGTPDDTTDDSNVDGVFYREVTDLADSKNNWTGYVLAGRTGEDVDTSAEGAFGYVTVLESVEKDDMEELTQAGASLPTLTFTAYAYQLWEDNDNKFDPYVAWTNVYAASTN